jgi:23S rRNA pseudouridine1911/1915/1917 synthase
MEFSQNQWIIFYINTPLDILALMKITVQNTQRLDQFLSNHLNQTRNQVENFIKNVGVSVNGKLVKKCGLKLNENDEIEYELLEYTNEKKQQRQVDFEIDILYEDDDLLVVNKPPFLTVHDAPSVKDATLVDWLKSKNISLSTISGEERFGIVHRIDKETSGALVVAKNNQTHLALSKQLEDKTMGRYYIAIIDLPLKENITVESFISRHPTKRTKMANVSSGGKFAKTSFIKLQTSQIKNYELIAAKLYTGRTHQIRVHLSKLSRHILADTLYGFKSKDNKIPRVMLHATMLYFKHPTTNQNIKVKAPLFDDFKNILDANFEKNIYEKIDENLL